MSFQYSSLSNGFSGVHGDRPPHGRLRWAESHDCSPCTETLRSNQFGGQLTIKQEATRDPSAGFNQNSLVEQGARYSNYQALPFPICSPVPSSPDWSSHNTDESRSTGSYCNTRTEGSIVLYNGGQSQGKEQMEAAPDGVGPSSSRPDNASFGVLAANLHSNRESKPTPEYPEEENDGVQDIHVAVEQSRADAISNERRRPARRLQHSWSDTSMVSFVSSDSESISLSREFDNVLAAARSNSSAAQASSDSNRPMNILNENSSVRTPAVRSSHLPGIGEEEPARSTTEEAGRDRNVGHVNYDNSNRRDSLALVPTSTIVAEGNRDQISAGRDYFALVPISGSPERTDRDAPTSPWDAQHNERGTIVEIGNRNGENIPRESNSSSARSNENRLSTPKELALQKVKRDEIEAKAVAWEEAKMAKVDNRFKRDEAIIGAWENEQKVKANIKMKKVERKLEEKKAMAFEKMQNEIAKAHKKEANRRAVAEARRGAAKAKISEASDRIRSLGRFPKKFLLF